MIQSSGEADQVARGVEGQGKVPLPPNFHVLQLHTRSLSLSLSVCDDAVSSDLWVIIGAAQ